MTDLSETLRAVPIFSELPQSQIQWLIEQGQEIWLDPGDIHRYEGDLADYVFVMLAGQVRVYQEIGNQELVLATYQTHDLFGELPVLTGEDYFWASGRAIAHCHIFELPKGVFWQLLSRCPSVTMRVLSTMAQRMQAVQSLYQLSGFGHVSSGTGP